MSSSGVFQWHAWLDFDDVECWLDTDWLGANTMQVCLFYQESQS